MSPPLAPSSRLAATITSSNGAWSGAGTLNVNVASGTFTINASLGTNFTGTILLNDASVGTFRFNSGGSASGAQVCTGSQVATFDLGTNSGTLLNRNGGGSSFGTYFLGALAGSGAEQFRQGQREFQQCQHVSNR